MTDTNIYHHGVKGMRWGVRRDRKKTGRIDTSSMSDEEIRSAINRLKLERELASMQSSAMQSGAKEAKRILVVAGTAGLTAMATKLGQTAVERMLKKD